MGVRGPARTPVEVLKLRGSTLPGRKERKSDLPSLPGRPECPKYFTKEQKSTWNTVCNHLERMNILASTDAHAITRYCVSMSRWIACNIFMNKHGTTFEKQTEQGVVRCEYPEFTQSERLGETLRKLEAQFGLTPSARASLQVERQKPEDDLESFTRKRG